MILHREGSVSMPGVNDEVQRHARVRISYQNVNGNARSEESDGLRSVCHQHEIDQLNGLFWINRLSRLKRERLIKQFEKMSRVEILMPHICKPQTTISLTATCNNGGATWRWRIESGGGLRLPSCKGSCLGLT
jgi:hypothetical protein